MTETKEPYTAAATTPELGGPDLNYADFVRRQLAAGQTPNDIIAEIGDALDVLAIDWMLWGDGEWYPNNVCSICGSGLPGICGHHGTPDRRVILRREYEQEKRNG